MALLFTLSTPKPPKTGAGMSLIQAAGGSLFEPRTRMSGVFWLMAMMEVILQKFSRSLWPARRSCGIVLHRHVYCR